MRISAEEKETIVSAIKSKDPSARIWLFGSRTNDSRKGGDIDLAVLSPKINRLDRMRIRRVICDILGEQKIDLIVSRNGSDAFFRLAVEKGLVLDE